MGFFIDRPWVLSTTIGSRAASSALKSHKGANVQGKTAPDTCEESANFTHIS